MIEPAARGAWRELEARLRPYVERRVPSPADADDVMQDVFLRMQRGLAGLRDDERFGPWVYQLTRHAIVDHHRARARYYAVDDIDALVDGRAGDAPESGADGDGDSDGAEQAVARHLAVFIALLPSPYREALTLVELEGLTQRQAAEMLGISLPGMKSRVQRGRLRLRQALEDCCEIALDARGHVMGCAPRPDGRLPNGVETRQFLPNCCNGDLMSKVPSHLAPSPSLWRRADVADPAAWTETLTAAELDDLRRVAAGLGAKPLDSLTPADLPADGPIAQAAARWRHTLKHGRGFVLLRGLDVAAFSPDGLARAYVALGLHLGQLVPQNLKGDLLTDVRDTGADPNNPAVRLYTTRAEQDFHTDGADIVGLLCRRTARRGGASRIVSSGAIVAEIQRTRPGLFAVLFDDFPWRYQEEGLPPFVLTRPICTAPSKSDAGATLNTFFIPWYIRRSQELTDAPRLTDAQAEAVAEIERLANDPRFFLDMTFEPGDIQWIKNAAILHKRTAYDDFDAPDEKRHLLRLWLSAPDFDDGDDQLRAGVGQRFGTEA
jgi:RNA polymerase sigma factor (sigma-70 family)